MQVHFQAPVQRRLLLALGALAVLDGCATSTGARLHAASAASKLPGDSHPQSSPLPTPAPATPDACPTVPGLVQHPGDPQHYLPCSGTNIALTIDDGPDPRWTPKVLALLARYRVRATFCMIGRHAAAYPHLVAAVIAGGHQVANHTFTHPIPISRLTNTQIADELNRTNDAIIAAGGTRPTLFRSPGGIWPAPVLAACAQAGMRPLDWSVDPRDWSRPGVPHIVDVIMSRTRPGSIILDHDGGGDRQQTLDALTIVLPRLLDAGYRFTQP